MRYDQYAFVPARGGVLAPGGRLPVLEDEWRVELLAAQLPPTAFLRTAASVNAADEHALRLRVFEEVDEPGAPPAEIDVPVPLRTAFDRCVGELEGRVPIPAQRPAWSRPGFDRAAEAWAGMQLELVRKWPLSAVLRNGDVYFKAVFPRFHHEPAITQALGSPHVLRADHERGWMLVEAAEGEGDDHHAAMRAIAAVHRAWTSRVDEALALGAPDRRQPSVLPHTLIHGDFHPGNVVGGTIIDWSDAAIANPLFDVNYYALMAGDDLRAALVAAYAEAWPEHDVVAAVDDCESEAYEYVAESYRGIIAACAPDDRWWFDGEVERWLARASDVRAGRRPSLDM